jgi:putative endonuclease
MSSRHPCVYILASQKRGTTYIGVTSNLTQRLHQHRTHATPGFTFRHGVIRLVHAEFFDRLPDAIAREKQLKNWHRDWKINLIEAGNPDWNDLGIAWGLVEGKRRTP